LAIFVVLLKDGGVRLLVGALAVVIVLVVLFAVIVVCEALYLDFVGDDDVAGGGLDLVDIAASR
jgi:hypothetical protein